MQPNPSLSLSNPDVRHLSVMHKIALTLIGLGILLIVNALFGGAEGMEGPMLWMLLLSLGGGILLYAYAEYGSKPAGIKNNGVWFFSETSRGSMGWIMGVILTLFYVALYWYPEWLGLRSEGVSTGLVALFNPLSYLLSGQAASQWFVYGTFYTLAILAMGGKFIWKYRHNSYQIVRTSSVMFFQLGFAFLIPEFMARLNAKPDIASLSVSVPYYDFKNMWPLNYYNFDGYRIDAMTDESLNSLTHNLGFIMLAIGIGSVFVISPILTYFFGKRWYCSWVCGCGGLAETAGDPYRHLSDKSVKAWNIERWLIYSVLTLAVMMTVAVVFSYLSEENHQDFLITKQVFTGIVAATLLGLTTLLWARPKIFSSMEPRIKVLASVLMVSITGLTAWALVSGSQQVFFIDAYPLRKWYGFFIGAAFSGVVGVGFYPLMGSRVWCRFGCPMAAILGLQQRFFSKFRITTNGGQCISCGNCSTYCEMGIDVRSYAQKGQNIVRSSCVGCGICAAVCPRGVLKLENGPNTDETRMEEVRF